jgi:hypothetical protein
MRRPTTSKQSAHPGKTKDSHALERDRQRMGAILSARMNDRSALAGFCRP